MLRLVGGPPYAFADLSLEGAFLMGLLGGRVVGPIGGAIITIPALIFHEWLAMPAASTAGLLGGLIRQAIPNKEDLWNFGPLTFLNIPKATCDCCEKRNCRGKWRPWVRAWDWNGARAWCLRPNEVALRGGLALGLVAGAGSDCDPDVRGCATEDLEQHTHRDELEQHQQLLLKARMDALSSQINPHFLFNTLNTVSALIRFDPDSARGVVLKLSNILRRLLRKHETFCAAPRGAAVYRRLPGHRSGAFWKRQSGHREADRRSRARIVCAQHAAPADGGELPEHGLAPKLGGGKIELRTTNRDGRLLIEIEDTAWAFLKTSCRTFTSRASG